MFECKGEVNAKTLTNSVLDDDVKYNKLGNSQTSYILPFIANSDRPL